MQKKCSLCPVMPFEETKATKNNGGLVQNFSSTMRNREAIIIPMLYKKVGYFTNTSLSHDIGAKNSGSTFLLARVPDPKLKVSGV